MPLEHVIDPSKQASALTLLVIGLLGSWQETSGTDLQMKTVPFEANQVSLQLEGIPYRLTIEEYPE